MQRTVTSVLFKPDSAMHRDEQGQAPREGYLEQTAQYLWLRAKIPEVRTNERRAGRTRANNLRYISCMLRCVAQLTLSGNKKDRRLRPLTHYSRRCITASTGEWEKYPSVFPIRLYA